MQATPSLITLILAIKNDNPVNSGVSVTWTTDKESLLAKPLTFTDSKGIADVELTRNPAGIAKVNAVLISGSYPAPDINFVADDVDENSSENQLNSRNNHCQWYR